MPMTTSIVTYLLKNPLSTLELRMNRSMIERAKDNCSYLCTGCSPYIAILNIDDRRWWNLDDKIVHTHTASCQRRSASLLLPILILQTETVRTAVGFGNTGDRRIASNNRLLIQVLCKYISMNVRQLWWRYRSRISLYMSHRIHITLDE